MNMNTTLKFKTLDDSPCGEDEFGGPHRKVADSLLELLSTGQVGGHLIGLEGSYGGGKTNIVRMLQKSLSTRPEWRCVVFDPSAHKDDPQRRSFLETLIDSLADETRGTWLPPEIVNDGRTKWDIEKLELANKIRVDRTKTVPKPTLAGKLYAASLLAVTFSGPFVPSVQEWREVFSNGDWPTYLSSGLGFLLLFSPLIVFLFDLLGVIRSGEDCGVFFSDSVTDTTTTTTTTPDQTSIEFVTKFRELMSDVLDADPKRRVLVVIDNLDRLDAERLC